MNLVLNVIFIGVIVASVCSGIEMYFFKLILINWYDFIYILDKKVDVEPIFDGPKVISNYKQGRIQPRSFDLMDDILMIQSLTEEEQRERCRVTRLTALYKMALVWMAKNDGGSRFKNPCSKYWPRQDWPALMR